VLDDYPEEELGGIQEALEYMGLEAGKPISGTGIDVAFIGSCTNGRISDLREAANIARGHHVAKNVKALVVPGSQQVSKQAVAEGLDRIFEDAGFEWREAGCSMCLAMNPDITDEPCNGCRSRHQRLCHRCPRDRQTNSWLTACYFRAAKRNGL